MNDLVWLKEDITKCFGMWQFDSSNVFLGFNISRSKKRN